MCIATQSLTGKRKSENYQDTVTNFISIFHYIGADLSIKMHFLFSHLDFFPIRQTIQ